MSEPKCRSCKGEMARIEERQEHPIYGVSFVSEYHLCCKCNFSLMNQRQIEKANHAVMEALFAEVKKLRTQVTSTQKRVDVTALESQLAKHKLALEKAKEQRDWVMDYDDNIVAAAKLNAELEKILK